jgi:hypothetical protein
MSLRNLPVTTLREALSLLEQRAALLKQLAQVDSQLASLAGAQAAATPVAAPKPATVAKPVAKPTPKTKTASGRRRMKEEVLELLKAAGPDGITVGELASRLGVGVNRIFTWFYSTGKNIEQIKKVANARYRWVG